MVELKDTQTERDSIIELLPAPLVVLAIVLIALYNSLTQKEDTDEN
jgi:hypothetical protein